MENQEVGKLGRENAAQFLGISTRTLGNYVGSGKIVPVYVKGKTCDVQEFDLGDLQRLKLEREGGIAEVGKGKGEVGIPNVETSIVRASPEIPAEVGSEEVGNVANLVSAIFSTFEAKMLDVPLDRRPVLTLAACAQLTGISEKLLRDAARAGALKTRKIGRSQRVRQQDLKAWLDAQFT